MKTRRVQWVVLWTVSVSCATGRGFEFSNDGQTPALSICFYLLSNYSSNFLSIDCLQSMFGHPVKQKETGSPFYSFNRNQEVLQRRVLWETLVGYDERIHFELSFIGLHNNDFEKMSRYRDIVFADHLIFYVYFTVWLQSVSNNDLSIVRCIIVSGR